MLRRFRRLPSPALVIASIALILAVGGGSFALAITDKKSDKRIAKRVSNRQITRRAPHLSVNHANSADNATQLGGLAAGAYQRDALWANVEPNGTIAFQSGGITVSHPSTGLYFINFGGITTPDHFDSATPRSQIDTTLIAFPCGGGPGAGTCSQTNDNQHLLVRTRSTAGADADRGFFVGLFP